MATTAGTSASVIWRIVTCGAGSSRCGAVAISGTDTGEHAARELQIVPRLALLARRAQQIGGMIRDDERRIEWTEAVHATAQARERRVGREQRLRGDAPDRQDELRPDERDLAREKRHACGDFIGAGIAICGRTRFENVRDVDVLAASEPYGTQHRVQ